MNSEQHDAWWHKAEEELEKLPNDVLRAVHEEFFWHLNRLNAPVPELEITFDGAYYYWQDYDIVNRQDSKTRWDPLVVTHDHNMNCKVYIPQLGTFNLPLTEKDVEQITAHFSEPPVEEEEFFPTKPPTHQPTPVSKKEPDMMKMMGSMMKSLETILKDDFEEKDKEPQVEKQSLQLDNLGRIISMAFVTFLGFLRWFIGKLSNRIPMKSAMKFVIIDMIEEVNSGDWDDFFDLPDDWLRTRASKLHSIINWMFGILRFILENKNVIVPLVTFGVGYNLGRM